MNDRGMKKWAPFDSLTNSKLMKEEISKKKQYIPMPSLSSDQLQVIEQNIIEAFYNKNDIKIYYYVNGKILNKIVKIIKLDYIKKNILLNDNTTIYYKQITNTKII